MKRFFRSFRQLRWKLTLSYTVTSVVGFFLVITVIIGGVFLLIGLHPSDAILGSLQAQASQATPYLATASTDPEPLAVWLHITAMNDATQQGPFDLQPIFLVATDSQGKILASAGSQPLTPGTSLQAQLTPQSRVSLGAVLGDTRGHTNGFSQDADDTLVAMVPLMSKSGQVQGALVMKAHQPLRQLLLTYFFDVVLLGGTAALTLAAIVGLIFGSLIARGLTRRLQKLSAAANTWSRGDFSAQAVDPSQDELGQMARQFNQMAGQLQNLVEARQQLATLEERNRLARDLHDSVKQQIFAVALQIASTRLVLKRDIGAADQRLKKMEEQVQQIQQELTSLIRELRPVALESKGLEGALRELLLQWSQQHDIVAHLRVEGAPVLPLVIEEAMFRVTQEALSNIARHSKATQVQFILSRNDEIVELTIQDNGQGFDLAHLERRGIGLFSMQERMKALGGDARVESTPGQGTRVVVQYTHPSKKATGIEPAQSVQPEGVQP